MAGSGFRRVLRIGMVWYSGEQDVYCGPRVAHTGVVVHRSLGERVYSVTSGWRKRPPFSPAPLMDGRRGERASGRGERGGRARKREGRLRLARQSAEGHQQR